MDTKQNIIKLAQEYPCNVLTEEVFQKSIRDIFHLLAEVVGRTVGPYGGASMIEEMGDYHMTKDGWTVLKNIHFNNRKDNTILNLIRTISHQMVMKVGDGSTTAILAAHEFLNLMSQNDTLKDARPKDIQDDIRTFVDELCEIIQQNAKQVTDENYVDIMESVARIATNDNEEYTQFIKEIYKQSGKDTSISKRMSPTEAPKYDIMDDMFYIQGRAIDRVYFNAENGKKCNIAHPHLLLFDFTLGNEHWDIIRLAYRYMEKISTNDRLVVIAPNYDDFFLDHVKSDAHAFIQNYSQNGGAGAIPFPIVFVKNPPFSQVERQVYRDLPPFVGAQLLSPLDAQGLVKGIGEYYKLNGTYQKAMDTKKQAEQAYAQMMHNAQSMGKNPLEIERPKVYIPEDDGTALREELVDKVGTFFGTCGAISIGEENVEFHGFPKINQALVDTHILDAKSAYEKEMYEVENARYITKNYIAARDRLARLACKSAMIYVGGHSALEKKMNDDALDDAIQACRSTISYGYNLGNNLAIFEAIEQHKKNEGKELSERTKNIRDLLKKSFMNVLLRIHQNKKPDTTIDFVEDVVKKSLETDKCYDLNTGEYNDKIINSSRTDIEILRSAISIIGTILSANQYVAADIMEQPKTTEIESE